MLRHSITASVLLAGLLSLAGPAGAEPIELEELIVAPPDQYPDGFPNTGPGFPAGTLDVGVNRVFGASMGRFGHVPDPDFISFELPAGLQITGIELSVSFFSNEGEGTSGIQLLAPSSGSGSFDGVGTVVVDPFTIIGPTISIELWPGLDPPPEFLPWFDSYTYLLSVTVAEPTTNILRVDETGTVWAYPSVADFAANTNAFQVTNCTPPAGFLTDRGFFEFQGKFYAVSGTGEILEYPTAIDFACDTNGTSIGTVPEYADDLGFLAVPEPDSGLSLVAGVITLLGLTRARRRRQEHCSSSRGSGSSRRVSGTGNARGLSS